MLRVFETHSCCLLSILINRNIHTLLLLFNITHANHISIGHNSRFFWHNWIRTHGAAIIFCSIEALLPKLHTRLYTTLITDSKTCSPNFDSFSPWPSNLLRNSLNESSSKNWGISFHNIHLIMMYSATLRFYKFFVGLVILILNLFAFLRKFVF